MLGSSDAVSVSFEVVPADGYSACAAVDAHANAVAKGAAKDERAARYAGRPAKRAKASARR